MTLLTHVLHWAPRAPPPEPWSGGCRNLFERAAGSRDWTHDASPIIRPDIALEDASRFLHETAARWCARC